MSMLGVGRAVVQERCMKYTGPASEREIGDARGFEMRQRSSMGYVTAAVPLGRYG